MAASVARAALPRFARAVAGRAKAQVRAMSSVVELSSYLVPRRRPGTQFLQHDPWKGCESRQNRARGTVSSETRGT